MGDFFQIIIQMIFRNNLKKASMNRPLRLVLIRDKKKSTKQFAVKSHSQIFDKISEP